MGAPYGEMAAAYQELADEDLTNDIASGHGPKVAQLATDLDPSAQNIFGAGSFAIVGYDQESFLPISAQSTNERLTAFDQRTNSEIAIGWTKNSVYNSIQQGSVRYAKTYYPIGDPPIMVTVNTNGEDPSGDFWKCEHGSYATQLGWTAEELEDVDWDVDETLMRPKNVIIETTDGIRYCMPFVKAALTSPDRKTVLDSWARDEHGFGNFLTPNKEYRDPIDGEYRPSENGAAKNRVLVFADWVAAAATSEAVLSFEVPFPSEVVDAFEFTAGTPGNGLNLYREENLKSLYKARQLPRENEYKVTYNIIEKEALQRRFGQTADLSTTLNGLYIGLASFLATTTIEVAYTFKKVDTQQLTPEQVTPSNLALSPGTNIINAQVSTDDVPFSTTGYYPSDYVDTYSGEAYRAPTSPAGGFHDTGYYERLDAMWPPAPEEEMTDDAVEGDSGGSGGYSA